MESALIGLVGVLLGIILNELLRRRNRIENYSTIVFDRRLRLYEELNKRVSHYYEVADVILENKSLTAEERKSLVSDAIFQVAEFCDENELYINEEITVHCVPILMGFEEVPDIKNKSKRNHVVEKLRADLLAAKRMIRKEAGITDIEKLFSSITKSEHSSPTIEYFRKLKTETGRKGKFE